MFILTSASLLYTNRVKGLLEPLLLQSAAFNLEQKTASTDRVAAIDFEWLPKQSLEPAQLTLQYLLLKQSEYAK